MKNLTAACFIICAFSFNTFARLAIIPLDELIKDSDLIVVGTLTGISEHSENHVIRGTGEIVIEKVIAGNVKTTQGFPLKSGDRLQLNYFEGFACVYGSHKRIENEKGIFLLTINGQEEIQYENFRSLDSLSEIKRFLQKGVKPNKIAKRIKIQNKQIVQTSLIESPENQNAETNFCAMKSNESDAKEYSPMKAVLVVLASILLYRVLYRNRFKP
jgi:hypothetical protein